MFLKTQAKTVASRNISETHKYVSEQAKRAGSVSVVSDELKSAINSEVAKVVTASQNHLLKEFKKMVRLVVQAGEGMSFATHEFGRVVALIIGPGQL